MRSVATWVGIATTAALAVMLVAAAALRGTGTPTPSPTPLPDNFTLLPSFTPAFACEMDVRDTYSADLCRSERVEERAITQDGQTVLYTRDVHVGTGCWSGINVDRRSLWTCDLDSGARTLITDHFAADPVRSHDGTAFAFYTLNLLAQPPNSGIQLDIYRINADGSGMLHLSPRGLPNGIVGAAIVSWSEDDQWLELSLWDGTENGWHPYRLAADGSGVFARLPD